jgi:transposase
MAQRDGYFRFSRISEANFGLWLRCFAFDLTATQAAEMTGLSIGSVNDIYLRLRRKIAENGSVVLRLAVSGSG